MLTPPPITPRDVGGAHPPAKWPFGLGSKLWPQMPTPRMSTPHGNVVAEGSGSPSHRTHSAPKALPVALLLWFSKKRGEGLPRHGVVSSLASDPHLSILTSPGDHWLSTDPSRNETPPEPQAGPQSLQPDYVSLAASCPLLALVTLQSLGVLLPVPRTPSSILWPAVTSPVSTGPPATSP